MKSVEKQKVLHNGSKQYRPVRVLSKSRLYIWIAAKIK